MSPFRFKLNFNSFYSNSPTMQYPISDFFDDIRPDNPPGMAIFVERARPEMRPPPPPNYFNFQLVFPSCNGIFSGLL